VIAGRAADTLGIRNLYLVLAAIALLGAIILVTFVREPNGPEAVPEEKPA
jgi:hypothetical protein